jgi:hypothetical protein
MIHLVIHRIRTISTYVAVGRLRLDGSDFKLCILIKKNKIKSALKFEPSDL